MLSATTRLPAILGLLLASSPAAVAGFIVAIVVDAFEGEPARAQPHIGEEVPELQPSLADGDPAPTILGEVRGARVEAPLPHVTPDGPLRRPAAPVSQIACALPDGVPDVLGCLLATAATAAYGGSASERGSEDRHDAAAVAAAGPLLRVVCLRRGSRSFCGEYEPSKAVAGFHGRAVYHKSLLKGKVCFA